VTTAIQRAGFRFVTVELTPYRSADARTRRSPALYSIEPSRVSGQ
jgi:PP-loop superfamily ATP-utilizing enzyme